jgi:hypothetical protein
MLFKEHFQNELNIEMKKETTCCTPKKRHDFSREDVFEDNDRSRKSNVKRKISPSPSLQECALKTQQFLESSSMQVYIMTNHMKQ